MPNPTATMPEALPTELPDGAGSVGTGTAQPRQRPTTSWDVAGVLLLACVSFGLTDLVAAGFDRFHRPRQMVWLTLLVGLGALVQVCRSQLRERGSLARLPARLTEVWRQPPASWPAFVLGWAMTVPLTWLYIPLFADADSMRLLASVGHVQRGNFDHLTETQDSLGPHLILGPAMAVAGWSGLRLVTIVSMQLLAAVLAWLAYRFSRSIAAAAVAPLALFAIQPFVSRAIYLPMYPAMLLFGTVGAWFAYRAIGEGARWPWAAAGALSLTMAFEAQAVGQLLLAVPLLLLVLAPCLRTGLYRLAVFYGFMTLFLIPRFLINISDGGLSHMRSNRTDYWTTKGYLGDIQKEHWGYSGLDESYPAYVLSWPERFVTSLGNFGWVAAAAALVGIFAIRGRPRAFAVAFLGLVLAAMAVKTIQPFDRYFSPLWPGVSLLAALGVAWGIRHGRPVIRVLGVASLLALVAVSATRFYDTGRAAQHRVVLAEENNYAELVALIDDGKGLIGSRPHTMLAADVDLPTYGGQFLSEEEFATYLTWPSDEAVLAVMEERDIGWALVRRKTSLEIDYHNIWLVPSHGREARHVEMLDVSPNMCLAGSAPSVLLYKVGSCA